MNATVFIKSLEYITGTKVTTTGIIKICGLIGDELITGFDRDSLDRRKIVSITKSDCETVAFIATCDLLTESALKQFIEFHINKLKRLIPLVAVAIDKDCDGDELVKARSKAEKISNERPSHYAP